MKRHAAQPPTTHRPSDERSGRAIRTPSTWSPSRTAADQAATTLSGTGRTSTSPQCHARLPAHTTGRGSTSFTPNAVRTCAGRVVPAGGRTGATVTAPNATCEPTQVRGATRGASRRPAIGRRTRQRSLAVVAAVVAAVSGVLIGAAVCVAFRVTRLTRATVRLPVGVVARVARVAVRPLFGVAV